jgi:hypothetical protein
MHEFACAVQARSNGTAILISPSPRALRCASAMLMIEQICDYSLDHLMPKGRRASRRAKVAAPMRCSRR